MHNDDLGRFTKIMDQLGRVYGKDVEDDLLQIYWRALRDLSLGQIQAFAEAHLKRGKFFPKPAELRPRESGYVCDAKGKDADVRCMANLAMLEGEAREREVLIRRTNRILATAPLDSPDYVEALTLMQRQFPNGGRWQGVES